MPCRRRRGSPAFRKPLASLAAGYTYATGEGRAASQPVWQRQLPEIDGTLGLGFLDLMETQFVDTSVINEAGEPQLLDLVKSQFAFTRVIGPSLYAGIEFSNRDMPVR